MPTRLRREKDEKETDGGPRDNCPEPKTILCDPAGSATLPIVHTIARLAVVIVHEAVSDAEPDAGTSKPAGEAAPVK